MPTKAKTTTKASAKAPAKASAKAPAKASAKAPAKAKAKAPAKAKAKAPAKIITKSTQKFPIFLVLLRLAIGWLFLYAGLTKFYTPDWSAAEFLTSAKTFPEIYSWFGSAANLSWVNFMNIWGQILIGLGLITGTFTRFAAWSGIVMMALYYFPGLDFPNVGHGFLVDDHIIYILVLAIIAKKRAGRYVGLDQFIS